MDVTIEIVNEDNIHLLDAVAEDVFDEAINPGYLARYVQETNHVLCVAVADSQVVGQARAIIHRHPDNPPELYIDNVGVSPAYQRRGIARMLVTEIVARGKAHGCEEIWVGTEPENEPATALYRSLGLDKSDMVMFDGKI